MSSFSLDDIKNSACGKRNTHLDIPVKKSKIVTKHFKKRSKEKDFISWNLLYFCNENNLTLQEELKFHPERKWRFDWSIESLKIAIEYEGIFSQKSRHTTLKGYAGDSLKYREAAKLGWTVLRYTAVDYKNVLNDLKGFLLL